MLIKLSKRMKEIKNLITYKRVADIGCDHGKILVLALYKNLIDYAIFSDISKPSAKKPEVFLKKLALTNYDIRVGDGLSTIQKKDNIEEVIISGMGGEEIINILSNNSLKFKSYILQPQNNEEKLKNFLINNGYKIVFDKIIYDGGKFYNIIKAKIGKGSITPKSVLFGINNKNNKDFILYLNYLKNKYTKLLTEITDTEKLKSIKSKLKLIEGEIDE